jgi:aspartyl protease family protein
MKRNLIAALSLLAPAMATATDVTVVGLFPGKAVVTINRGAPRTLSVGQRTAEGVVLVSVDGKAAVLEIDGRKQSLEMGQHFESAASTGERNEVTIAAGTGGHFMTSGQINGNAVRFMVDTGATLVALPAVEARRLGIDYEKGQRGRASTAGGIVPSYRIKLDSVTVGGITLLGVDASVVEAPGMDFVLLGNSFLSRTEMRREGTNLTLIKRY